MAGKQADKPAEKPVEAPAEKPAYSQLVEAVFEEGAEASFGFYGTQRRKHGDRFYITDPKHFSKKWMKKVEAPASPAASDS